MRSTFRLRTARWLSAACLVLLFAPPAEAQDVENPAATRHYALAVGLQNKKLFPQAAQRWTTFIQTYPQDNRLDKAHHYLGICQLQQRQFTEAAASFRHVLATWPQFASLDAAQLNLALALYHPAQEAKQPDALKAAAAAFADVISRYPQSKHVPAALYFQAESLYQAGDPTAALPFYRQLLANHPQSELAASAAYALGTAQQELGQAAEAAATLQAFLTAHAEHPQANEVRLRLGICLESQQKWPEAEAQFTPLAALADFSYADEALLRQARCTYERGQPDAAVALYKSLPQRFPMSKSFGAALLAAGLVEYQKEQFAAAQATLAQAAAAAQSPAAPRAAYWLARTHIRLAQPAQAVAAADAALAAHPQSDYTSHLALVRIDALYEQPDQRPATVALYLDFAAKHPDHELAPQAAYMAALAALGVGNRQAALAHATAFLANVQFAAHPLVPDVQFLAAEAHVQSVPALATPVEAATAAGTAEQLYRKLIAEHPQHRQAPQAQVRVGLCLYLAKKHDDAVAYLTPLVAGLKDPATLAEAQLVIGRSHADAGRAAAAIPPLEAAVTAKPDWTRGDESLLALAYALRTEKRGPEAAARLTQLNAAFPQSRLRDQSLYMLGEIALDEQKYDEAVLRYQEAVAAAPQGETASAAALGIGLAQYRKKDYAVAVTALGNVLTAYPQSTAAPQAQYLRGMSQLALKQFDAAAADLNSFLAAKPAANDALDARYALAMCQSGLLQHAAAAQTLTAILAERPDYPQADRVRYELGFALLEAKQDAESAAAFRELAAKHPDSPLAAESWYRVGGFHESAEQWTEATVAYTSGLERTAPPDLREKLRFKLGWVQYQAEQFPQAAAAFAAQIAEMPQGELAIDATYLSGECLFRQDMFEAAMPLFVAVVAAQPAEYHARALYRAGTCTAQLKQWPASQQHYAELIQKFPAFEQINEARYGLGWALQNQEKLAEARTAYEEVTKATDTETAAKSRFMIGECAFREKKYQEAIEHFLEAAVGYPYEEWQALGHFEVGRCFIELMDKAQAIAALETVVAQYPNHPKAQDAAKLIASLKEGV